MSDAGIEAMAVVLLTGVAAGWLAGLVTRGNGFNSLEIFSSHFLERWRASRRAHG